MEIAICLLSIATSIFSAFAFYKVGYAAGHTKGFDEGWLKRHFEQSSYEIHKRDRRGRFAPAKST